LESTEALVPVIAQSNKTVVVLRRQRHTMAPKKNKATLNDTAGVSEEQQAALALSQKLQAVAKSQGVRTWSICLRRG